METQFRFERKMQDAVEVGSSPVGSPIGESMNEIERMHPELDGKVQSPIGTKIHPQLS